MKATLHIRSLQLADYGAILPMLQELHELHVRHEPARFGSTTKALPMEEFQGHLGAGNAYSLVAEREGLLLGVCLAEWRCKASDDPRWKSRETVYVKALCVGEQYRREGVGRALLNEVARRAKRDGAAQVEVQVIEMPGNALHFYERIGYQTSAYSMKYELNEKEEKKHDFI